MYKEEEFSLRSVQEVKGDIDSMAAVCDELRNVSWQMGYEGEIRREAVIAMIQSNPALNTDAEVATLLWTAAQHKNSREQAFGLLEGQMGS